MQSIISKLATHAHTILRLIMSFVMLWFGLNQVLNPEAWTIYVPTWIAWFGLDAVTFVYLNAAFEIIFGTLLAFGIWLKPVTLLLFLHMFGIVVEVGITAIGVRDIGLAGALLYLFLYEYQNQK